MPNHPLKTLSLINNLKLKDVFFWGVFLICVVLFLLVKYQGPQLVAHLYAQGSSELLNRTLGVKDAHSLDFYLGVADNRLLGPLSSLAAGCALLLFCLKFLKEAKGWALGLTVFVYLFLTRPEALFYPPYGDALGGIFTDVIWIVRNNFDHFGFLFKQKTLGAGGYKQYPLSIYPSFLAFLIMATPTAKAFLVTAHSLVFLMGSAAVVAFRKILSEVFDREESLLLALSLVALPLFQSMAENINMEMASTLFSVLAVYFLIRERMFLAAGMAVMAFLVKATGITTCAAVFFGCMVLLVTGPKKTTRKKVCACAAAMLIFSIGMILLRMHEVGPQSNTTNVTKLFIGLNNIKGLLIFQVFCVTALVFLCRAFFWFRVHRGEAGRFRLFLEEHLVVLLMFTMCVLWFGLYANFLVMIHRYKLLIAPFLILAMAATFLPFIKQKTAVRALLVAAIVFSFFCSHGLLYRNSSDVSQNEFEGSLEYRNELKLMMKLAQKVDQEFPGFLVGSPYLMAQALDFHEIGFVKGPLDVMVYGHFSINEGVPAFNGLGELNIFKTVWVGFYKDYFGNEFYGFPVGPDDRILYEMEVGDQKGYIFLGGFAIERRRQMVQRAMILKNLHDQGRLPPEYEEVFRSIFPATN